MSERATCLIGLEWHGWHGFRRGTASNLYELGADEKIVQRVLRHAKAHVTKDRCIKAFDPAVLAAMKRMETTCHETLCTNCAPNKLGQCGKLLNTPRRGGRAAECGGLLNRFRD